MLYNTIIIILKPDVNKSSGVYRNNTIDIVPIVYYNMLGGDDMDFMTTAKAAEKWNISDRRVRTLCKEGKIEGAVLVGKTYRIPVDAKKPTDGRMKNAVGQAEY